MNVSFVATFRRNHYSYLTIQKWSVGCQKEVLPCWVVMCFSVVCTKKKNIYIYMCVFVCVCVYVCVAYKGLFLICYLKLYNCLNCESGLGSSSAEIFIWWLKICCWWLFLPLVTKLCFTNRRNECISSVSISKNNFIRSGEYLGKYLSFLADLNL